MKFTRHLSFANVMSLIAVFIALGGSAVAVQVAKKNSVNSSSIKNNSVRSADLSNGQVKAGDIGANQVRGSELAARSINTSHIANGALDYGDIDPASIESPTDSKSVSLGDGCSLTGLAYQTCGSTTVTFDRAGEILASVDGHADSGTAPSSVVSCHLTADGIPFTGDTEITATSEQDQNFSFTGIPKTLSRGNHTIALSCKGDGTDPGPKIVKPNISIIAIYG